MDELIVCDPFRNHLLKDGPKTDKMDAKKLVLLLKANLLKPVFHSGDQFLSYRELVSAYEDLVRAGVRLKNQRSALFQSSGESKKSKVLEEAESEFVFASLDRNIKTYEEEKAHFEAKFRVLIKHHATLRHLQSLPGVGTIRI